ncbi:MAG TPA: hypothetical protein VG944_07260 [Fimbriimonas sp.]|nr:hypothetical protein [Fimbriimonas sp.]
MSISTLLIIFLLIAAAGVSVHGAMGTVIVVLAAAWFIGGLGYHGSKLGYYGVGGRPWFRAWWIK